MPVLIKAKSLMGETKRRYRQFCIFLIRVGLYIYLSRTGLDCSIHVWSLSNLSFVTKLEKAHDKAICSMAANHNFLFTGSLNIIKVWQLDADKGESILIFGY